MDQEERERYLQRYGENILHLRDIHARFAVFASERLEGPQGEEWGRFLEMLMKTEQSNESTKDLLGVLVKLLPRPTIFPPWRTVRVGTHNPRSITVDFVMAIERVGMVVSSEAYVILCRPTFFVFPEEMDFELCVATVKELTNKDSATNKEVLDAIRNVGELCPAEVGPQLRLQYRDQPVGEDLLVGMEPIADSFNRLFVFRVQHDSGNRFLGACPGHADYTWSGEDRWVFRRKRIKANPFIFQNY